MSGHTGQTVQPDLFGVDHLVPTQPSRQDGRYLVETESGRVIRRASSYRAGAGVLARHHGYTPGRIEVEIERDDD